MGMCSLTSEQRDELCRLFYEGEMRVVDIATQFNVGISTVRYLGKLYLETLGLKRKKSSKKRKSPSRFGKDELIRIQKQHKSGTSVTKLSIIHNVSPQYIAMILKKPNLTKEEEKKNLKAPRNRKPADYEKMYKWLMGVVCGGGPVDLKYACNTRGFGSKKIMSMFSQDIHDIIKRAIHHNKLYIEQKKKHLDMLKEYGDTLEGLFDNKDRFSKEKLTNAFFSIKW